MMTRNLSPRLLVAAAGVALLAHLDYYDLLLHGGESAGQLDGILHQAV